MSQRMFGRRQGITRGAKVFDDWTIPDRLLEAMKDECEDLTDLRPDGESFLFPYVVGDRDQYNQKIGIYESIWNEVDNWLMDAGVYDGEQIIIVRLPDYAGVNVNDFQLYRQHDGRET